MLSSLSSWSYPIFHMGGRAQGLGPCSEAFPGAFTLCLIKSREAGTRSRTTALSCGMLVWQAVAELAAPQHLHMLCYIHIFIPFCNVWTFIKNILILCQYPISYQIFIQYPWYSLFLIINTIWNAGVLIANIVSPFIFWSSIKAKGSLFCPS